MQRDFIAFMSDAVISNSYITDFNVAYIYAKIGVSYGNWVIIPIPDKRMHILPINCSSPDKYFIPSFYPDDNNYSICIELTSSEIRSFILLMHLQGSNGVSDMHFTIGNTSDGVKLTINATSSVINSLYFHFLCF